MSWSRLTRFIRIALKRLALAGGASRRDKARVVDWLQLQPGMKVADIGAGFGDYAFAFARAVGPIGVVYAVDTDEDMRSEVAREAGRLGLDQVRAMAAQPDDAGIPEPVDLVFLSASFHHLPDQRRYFSHLRDSLRPGARIVVLESRPGAGFRIPGHATAPEEVQATMEAAGYRLLASADLVAGASVQAFGVDTPA